MKVLVAPLDWGLGHATRCAPIIQEFLNRGCDVEVAVVKGNASFLRELFPHVRQRLCPSYNVVYPKHGYNMGFWLLKNSAHLKAVIRAERSYVEEMVERHGYDIVVSDNRFAFYSKKAYSIYMTHQCRIAFPRAFRMFESIGKLWHASIMSHFDEVWIPDLPDAPGYAGSLSHVRFCPRPLKFVGALSRFLMKCERVDARNILGEPQNAKSDALNAAGNVSAVGDVESLNAAKNAPASGNAEGLNALGEAPAAGNAEGLNAAGNASEKDLKIVAVVSGVEPARSRFEAKLRTALAQIPGRHAMILGKPSSGRKSWIEGNITLYSHLPSDEFAQMISRAKWVVSRGGYSTVMDMAVLQAKCIFVPTPGQYEQIILARDLSAAGYAVSVRERDLSADMLNDILTKDQVGFLPKATDTHLLSSAVSEVLKKV